MDDALVVRGFEGADDLAGDRERLIDRQRALAVETIRAGYDADINGGWAPDGTLVVGATTLRTSLWRFRQESASSK